MAEWNRIKVQELGRIVTGKTPKTSDRENYGGDIPFLTPSDDMSVKYVLNTGKTLTEKGKLSVKGAIIPEDSVCVSCIGSDLGKVVITTCETVTNQQINSIVVDKEKFDKDFIYYAMLILGKELNFFSKTSTAVPIVNKTNFLNYEINCPDIKMQRRISSILSALDEKITENKAINENLEQQAQVLFKAWFIDNPENRNWKRGTFAELVFSTLNGDWGKEVPSGNNIEKVYCIRGADIPDVKTGNKGKMPIRYILPKNYANKQLSDGDIVVEISGGSPTQSTGRCTAITQSLLDRYDSGMVCTNFCKAIKPLKGYSMFVYYYWQYLYDRKVFFAYENGTTGIKNLDFSGFLESEVIIIPPVDKVQKFNDYCEAVFDQIFANGKQTEQLAVLRDTLLPKLMSGEIDVSTLDV
ncbi:restriction endonuclease subunit S [Eubacterium ramulus]